ncbi:MAG: response regulator transcription factor [Spirochaetales bacterium]|jgi:DNA-binding NarL/FixJ family response regulator|nr:response regulator transcription factor [Spirochaetales bacterium]
MKRFRIVIVDDHPIVRQGLEQLLEQEPDMKVSGAVGDAQDFMDLIKKEVPDIALVDLSLKNSSGLELIKDLAVQYPELKVLVISLHDEESYAERAIRAGARGFIMKVEATENLLMAIRRVIKGEIYLSEKMKTRLLEKIISQKKPEPGGLLTDGLTDREIEIFDLIGEGMKNQNIANKLSISIKTVETYKTHLKRKLNLKDSSELIQKAVEWNLTENYLRERNQN